MCVIKSYVDLSFKLCFFSSLFTFRSLCTLYHCLLISRVCFGGSTITILIINNISIQRMNEKFVCWKRFRSNRCSHEKNFWFKNKMSVDDNNVRWSLTHTHRVYNIGHRTEETLEIYLNAKSQNMIVFSHTFHSWRILWWRWNKE